MLDIEYPKLENNSFNNLDLLMNEPKIKITLMRYKTKPEVNYDD